MLDKELRDWLAVLPTLNHYEVLGLPLGATSDEVRSGFSSFAENFHPDGHRSRPRDEQEAVLRVYKRGTEAYRVLSDPELRHQYDAPMRQQITHSPATIEALKSLPRHSQPAPALIIGSVPSVIHSPVAAASPRMPSAAPASVAPARMTSTAPSGRLIDRVRVSAAKPFVMKAMALRDEKQWKKAKLELSMALNMDRDNPDLVAMMAEIEEGLKTAPKW